MADQSTSPKMGLSRYEVGSVLGMTAIFIITADREGIYQFLSDSIEDVLGYTPQFLLGKSCYITFHPDEIPVLLDIHRRSVMGENTACVTYMRLKHASGHYVACAVEHSTALDRMVGTITRAENGPLTIKQRLTAREVYEVHPTEQGKYTMRKWSRTSQSPSRSPSPAPTINIDFDAPWPKPTEPARREAYLIDRFTDSSRVVYVTNDVIVSSRGLIGQPFYSIVKPSDRGLVREHIQSVKAWSPVVRTERRSGGLGYAEFHVLKIPDLPPEGHTYPQGTDESERHMPGQEFILVEGIFTAGSDAVICVIQRIDRRKGKRDRGDEASPEGPVALLSEYDRGRANDDRERARIGGPGMSGSPESVSGQLNGNTSTSGDRVWIDESRRTTRRATDTISWVDTGLGARLSSARIDDGDDEREREREREREGESGRQSERAPTSTSTPTPRNDASRTAVPPAPISPRTVQAEQVKDG